MAQKMTKPQRVHHQFTKAAEVARERTWKFEPECLGAPSIRELEVALPLLRLLQETAETAEACGWDADPQHCAVEQAREGARHFAALALANLGLAERRLADFEK